MFGFVWKRLKQYLPPEYKIRKMTTYIRSSSGRILLCVRVCVCFVVFSASFISTVQKEIILAWS